MSQLQEGEMSTQAQSHTGSHSHSFSMLSCAGPVSQSSPLELKAMEHLFLILQKKIISRALKFIAKSL